MRIESRLSKCYWSCLALLLVSHTSLAGLASRSLIRETEVASTVIASQVSSYALVGQTLTFDSQQGGIIRVLLDIVDAFMSVFSGGNTDREDEAVEDGSGSGDGQEDGGSASGDYLDYEEEDGSGEGDLLSSVASVIRQVLGGQQDEDEDYLEEKEESGEASGAGADNDSFHVDIAEDSFLDWVFNIIPDTVNSITGGEEYDYEYVYDEDNRQGMNISTKDPSNGGGNIGGMTVSLHTVDLAELFVEVQKSILENTSGMNCTCGENLLTEENITNATIKIVQAQAEQQVKRKRLLEKKKRLLRSRIPKVLKY